MGDDNWQRVEPGTTIAAGTRYRIDMPSGWFVESCDPTADQVVADFYDGVAGSVSVEVKP